MSIKRKILMRMFGRPCGVLGIMGGIVLARANAGCGAWVAELLDIEPTDHVLEAGFGPGVVLQRLSRLASAGHVAGIDPSRQMVVQAHFRNAAAIRNGHVELRRGTVDSVPFEDNRFDKILAINSMQVWPDAGAGLRELRRIMKSGGRIALGFTSYSGQPKDGLAETLDAAGFTNTNVKERDNWFCVLASKP